LTVSAIEGDPGDGGDAEADAARRQSVGDELRQLGFGDGIVSVTPLDGGVVSEVVLVDYADGSRVVAKIRPEAPGDFFDVEVEGLTALADTATVAVPRVLGSTDRVLVLEALSGRVDQDAAWEAFAHDLASLHRETVGDRFGWSRDGYCGKLRQFNRWTTDGHAFFAEHRLLRYLQEPASQQLLDQRDRRAVEQLCARLPELVPALPPVMTHGDLWAPNILGSRNGSLALIDPAVSYTWGEVDLAILYMINGHMPAVERFFGVYHELNPSPDGWQERMPILFVRELLMCVAHVGVAPVLDPVHYVQPLRQILQPFYPGR
jgi:fructosamine-3-kinase